MIVSLGVSWLRLGPAFGDALVTQVTREHFINLRGFLSLQAGLLLIEGVVLFVAAARLSASRPEALPRLAAAVEIGALAALVATVWQLGKAAARGGAMWRSLVDLVWTLRWNAAVRRHQRRRVLLRDGAPRRRRAWRWPRPDGRARCTPPPPCASRPRYG